MAESGPLDIPPDHPPDNLAAADTPAMRQYRRFKREHPDCVLFFRMGDFYEMFFDDAKLANRVLGVALTQRTEGIPMAGVPFHSVENYLRRMIQAGYRVAICDQMEDPTQAKGLVKRDVTRVITPGTLTDDSLLDEARENPLAALAFDTSPDPSAGDGRVAGNVSIAWAELSTGAFQLTTVRAGELADELARIRPSELLVAEAADHRQHGAAVAKIQVPAWLSALCQGINCVTTLRPAWQFRQQEALECLRRQWSVGTLAGFGLADDDPALRPAAAVVHYLLETQKVTNQEPGDVPPGPSEPNPQVGGRIAHLQPPRKLDRSEHLIIDQTSLRSLEIEQTLRSGSVQGSLLGVLQDCRTGMGKRLLRQWLCYPLRSKETIESRQRIVGALVDDSRLLDALRQGLDGVQDVQRILGRLSVGRALPRDLVALGRSSACAAHLADLLADRPSTAGYWQRLRDVAGPLTELAQTVAAACIDSPPTHMREGGLFRDGYDAQLDEYRGLQRDSNTWLAGYQKQLVEQSGIGSLKVGFNKVFGFYIELSASQRDKAPVAWSRKQTLKNAERFITPELKEYEGKVLSADQRAIAREQELFAQLSAAAQQQLPALQGFAQVVAELDVLAGFARKAVRRRYVKPRIVDEPVLHIRGGRHPVLDEILGDRFVPNDVELAGGDAKRVAEWPSGQVAGGAEAKELSNSKLETRNSTASTAGPPAKPAFSLALITGPNMAGKSTYIRQAALITLMAHTGSYVPAEEATVGLCDRIFTRIGASDELHAGQSTFMVEMTETSNICHHATEHSLVILDEIGRGTGTLDGLSLAWAIAEHLTRRRCRTLFATHYHEITALAERFENVTNLNVTVREWADQIVFLHRIAAGRTDRSYGIHVAKLAGLPPEVVRRANELMSQLAVSHDGAPAIGRGKSRSAPAPLPLFAQAPEHPVVVNLREIDLDRLSPLEAFDLLRRLREQAREE